MAKNRQDKIDKLTAQIAEQQEQLKLEKKKQTEEQRKAKIKRLLTRHELFENMLPDIIGISDEQYKTFLTKHVINEHGRKILSKILSYTDKTIAEKQCITTAHIDNGDIAKQSDTATHVDEGSTTKQAM